MSESHSDRGASRLFHTIIVVGAFGAVACGGTVTETSPDGEQPATGGAAGGTGGTGGWATGGTALGTGGLPQNTGGGIVLPTGGTGGTFCSSGTGGVFGVGGSTPEACLEWDDFVCSDKTTHQCWCDPSQPAVQSDCAPSTYLLWHYPLARLCLQAVQGPGDCAFPAQYQSVWVEETESYVYVCDPYSPLGECDCDPGAFTCQSYDPPTNCQCYVGILK